MNLGCKRKYKINLFKGYDFVYYGIYLKMWLFINEFREFDILVGNNLKFFIKKNYKIDIIDIRNIIESI